MPKKWSSKKENKSEISRQGSLTLFVPIVVTHKEEFMKLRTITPAIIALFLGANVFAQGSYGTSSDTTTSDQSKTTTTGPDNTNDAYSNSKRSSKTSTTNTNQEDSYKTAPRATPRSSDDMNKKPDMNP